MKNKIWLFASLIGVFTASSCGAQAVTSIVVTYLPPSTVTVTQSISQTAGQLASPGENVLKATCAGCHTGGPVVLIGSSPSLGRYSNAYGLYNFISKNMPASAPGSLSPEAYLQATAFILLQNKYVNSDTQLTTNLLCDIPLP
jgi:alcohol dehydrogenase (cytochrome c)